MLKEYGEWKRCSVATLLPAAAALLLFCTSAAGKEPGAGQDQGIAAPLRLALSLQTLPSRSSTAAAGSTAAAEPAGRPAPGELAAAGVLSRSEHSVANAPHSAPSPQAMLNGAASPPARWEIAPSDGTIHATLARWAASAGWQLVWELQVDYPIESRATLQGSFEDAVATVARSLQETSAPARAIFYSGNQVLRIVAKGEK
ncbi:MAG TPA: toxin co-regulated pilus biosynthesis Q family protein [Noviherbaspirillum sp.]|jgi:hypothetical protein|uniref:toxin co-regulated pilus biosynthesis Q family protein n=1 Tax=Noviherbaspirillum sp. TaxID=1926288 RepID=UPI002F93A4A0